MTRIDAQNGLASVSCADSGFCMAIDGAGRAFVSAAPASGAPKWAASAAQPAPVTLTALACAAAGLCTAAGAGGTTAIASLPAPTVAGATGDAGSQTTALLSASVGSSGAAIVDCHFDYAAAGGAAPVRVPCSPQPRAGRTQIVSARVSGLRPSTSYRFRVVAAGALATAATDEGTLRTPPAVRASPSLQGLPAPGATLTCVPNLAAPGPVRLSFAWHRDAAPLPGVRTPRYHLTAADASHHVGCSVTVTGDGATTTATSGSVSVPSQAAPVESSAGEARVAGPTATVPVSCSPQAAGACTITLALLAPDGSGAQLGVAVAHVPPGLTQALAVSLGPSAVATLRRDGTLAAALHVDGTILGVLTAPLLRERIVFRSGPPAIVARGG
jgi:hypothetical protein